MKIRFLPIVFSLSLLIGFYSGFIVFAVIVHEQCHVLACIIFNVPVEFTLFHVVYDSQNLSALTQIIIGAAGGFGQAISSLSFFEVAFLYGQYALERRYKKWFLAAIGAEIAFFTIVIMGLVTAVWEGFFLDNYVLYYKNQVAFLVLVILSMVLSTYIVLRLNKRKRLLYR